MEHETIHEACSEDRAVFEKFPRNIWDWGEVSFPDHKSSEAYHTQNYHEDDVCLKVSMKVRVWRHEAGRHANSADDDNEGTESPSPRYVVQEVRGNLRVVTSVKMIVIT
ncbi:hypothetical protein KC342_g76 [Hortaea werneckii]|nr:hypothetical protein KC342_g76 [Hortaea werneckii]